MDDNPDVLMSMSLLLDTEGFDVLTAETVAAALHLLSRRPVAILVADLHLPGNTDGLDLIARVIRLAPPRPRIIAMSGAPNLAWRAGLQTARTVGADATFIKSLDPQMLVQKIRELLEPRVVGTPAWAEW